MRVSMVQRAQAAIAEVLTPGAVAVDATVGNGHDTLFLAEQVGARGRVYGFDCQAAAIVSTRKRLAQAKMLDRVNLIQAGHETLQSHLAAEARLLAVMFNLGYLPGSDKQYITRAETTLAALEQACALLAPGGRISLVLYTGHAGGPEEAAAVQARVAMFGAAWRVVHEPPPVARAPELVLIERRR